MTEPELIILREQLLSISSEITDALDPELTREDVIAKLKELGDHMDQIFQYVADKNKHQRTPPISSEVEQRLFSVLQTLCEHFGLETDQKATDSAS